MSPDYRGGEVLRVDMNDELHRILDDCLHMRRNVMDADLALIRTTFWNTSLSRSQLLKEVSRMITMGDYQAAKRWVVDNLLQQAWYTEVRAPSGGRGRRGIKVLIGDVEVDE